MKKESPSSDINSAQSDQAQSAHDKLTPNGVPLAESARKRKKSLFIMAAVVAAVAWLLRKRIISIIGAVLGVTGSAVTIYVFVSPPSPAVNEVQVKVSEESAKAIGEAAKQALSAQVLTIPSERNAHDLLADAEMFFNREDFAEARKNALLAEKRFAYLNDAKNAENAKILKEKSADSVIELRLGNLEERIEGEEKEIKRAQSKSSSINTLSIRKTIYNSLVRELNSIIDANKDVSNKTKERFASLKNRLSALKPTIEQFEQRAEALITEGEKQQEEARRKSEEAQANMRKQQEEWEKGKQAQINEILNKRKELDTYIMDFQKQWPKEWQLNIQERVTATEAAADFIVKGIREIAVLNARSMDNDISNRVGDTLRFYQSIQGLYRQLTYSLLAPKMEMDSMKQQFADYKKLSEQLNDETIYQRQIDSFSESTRQRYEHWKRQVRNTTEGLRSSVAQTEYASEASAIVISIQEFYLKILDELQAISEKTIKETPR